MHIVHLTASIFYGGPERQMLGLAKALPPDYRSSFLSFSEDGRGQSFVEQVRAAGFDGDVLAYDTPWLLDAARELAGRLRAARADVLLCHGYKANLVGRMAARRTGTPVLAVSRGWTGENLKVRLYETIDRLHLRYMDHVICVSEAQARKVRAVGFPPKRTTIIRNSARANSFRDPDPAGRKLLESFFATPGQRLVVAAGRLSPDKGFQVLIEAVRRVAPADPAARFLVFGRGAWHDELQWRIKAAGLGEVFVLGGFRDDLDRLLPSADLFVLPSFTEGLPNVVLEASAAGVPVVATAVGGTPEVLADGITGYLVPAGDADVLAKRVGELLGNEPLRQRMGQAGRQRVCTLFTFEAQAVAYRRLFAELFPHVAQPGVC
jgi:glycosyltransferase involved in cell wall biosynthesis